MTGRSVSLVPELIDGTYISDQEDQESYLGYDATHCEHGTFVGGWAGPDYMCHWCEQGITSQELAEIRAEDARLAARYARVKAAQLAAIDHYNGEGAGTPTYDSIVRLTIWLCKRSHWA